MAIPFFLFRTGNKPAGVGGHAGVRSMFAFWQGGGGASPSSPPPVTTPSDSIGSAIIPHGKHFSRKRWKELLEAIAAQQALEAKAQEVTGKRREVLKRAAQAAEVAIASIEEEETAAHSAELVRLKNVMNAATGAAKLADVVKTANAATAYALEMDDEEEEAIMLLMLH